MTEWIPNFTELNRTEPNRTEPNRTELKGTKRNTMNTHSRADVITQSVITVASGTAASEEYSEEHT